MNRYITAFWFRDKSENNKIKKKIEVLKAESPEKVKAQLKSKYNIQGFPEDNDISPSRTGIKYIRQLEDITKDTL